MEEAIESIDKLKGSPQGQAVMNAITEDAKEEGEKVQAVMRGWGAEAGSMTTTDVDSIIEYSKATPMGDKLKEIAKLAGRLKGLALNTMQDERKGVIGPATLPDKTKDVERLFQSEFIQMSQKAPRALRAVKIAEFIDKGGLLGWIPAARRKEYGDVEFYIDGSGSMSGNPEIVAKSVCLGIAKAMREDRGSTVDRWYRLSMFSTSRQGFIRCEHDSTWLTHMQWAAKMPNGGTDFNYVLKSAIEKITERHRKGKKGTDLILITDGIAKMSQEVIDDWKKLVSDTGARMFLIAVNIPDHYITQFEGLADFIFKVGSHGTLEMVADDLTEKISQFIVQNERR